MKDFEVNLEHLFKEKLINHKYFNPLLNREEDDYRVNDIINDEKYFKSLYEEFINIEERTFDYKYHRYSKYGTENNKENIDKSFKEAKKALFNGIDMSAYYIQDYTKHQTINIISEIFSKYNNYEREFLNYLKTNQSNNDTLFNTICNLLSKIKSSKIKYDILYKLIHSNENVTLSIQDLSICVSKLSKTDIQILKEKWIIVKDELNALLNDYATDLEREFSSHNYKAEDGMIKNEIKEILLNDDEVREWKEFFKTYNDYENFLDLVSNYFEGKSYNKEIIIKLKTGAKTKFNNRLEAIRKELSEESKLVNDIHYINLLRQIEHFKDVSDDRKIINSLQK